MKTAIYTPELVTEIAERLDVSENDVIDMNKGMAGHGQSLNNPFSAENDEEWINSLVDDSDNHENKFIYNQELFKKKMLATALKDLDEKREVHSLQKKTCR